MISLIQNRVYNNGTSNFCCCGLSSLKDRNIYYSAIFFISPFFQFIASPEVTEMSLADKVTQMVKFKLTILLLNNISPACSEMTST